MIVSLSLHCMYRNEYRESVTFAEKIKLPFKFDQ